MYDMRDVLEYNRSTVCSTQHGSGLLYNVTQREMEKLLELGVVAIEPYRLSPKTIAIFSTLPAETLEPVLQRIRDGKL